MTDAPPPPYDSAAFVDRIIEQHRQMLNGFSRACLDDVRRAGELLAQTLQAGGTVLACGNGGSAADAQHLAAEIAGRFETERRGLPAVALTTDSSILTAVTNDYGFEAVFARQVEALGRAGDALVAISTSGRSPNVLRALRAARERGVRTLGLAGRDGGEMLSLCDVCVTVPGASTARIQEMHILSIHIWCAQIDAAFARS